MSKKSGKTPLHASGPVRPKHGKPSVPAYERAIHGANPSVTTVERKVAPPRSKRAK
jgi:hypothetical protein